VTVELARRLIDHGGIAAVDIEAALVDVLRSGLPLVRALVERGPTLALLVERELSRSKAPFVNQVRPDPELARRLPPGMCERLLALPLRTDRKTGTIDVACVDPFDPQVALEIAFQLGTQVRILRAAYAEILSALDGLHAGGTFLEGVARVLGSPPLGMAAARPSAEIDFRSAPAASGQRPAPSWRPPPIRHDSLPVAKGPSEPPIPLVRKTSDGKRNRPRTDPGMGRSALPVVETLGEDERGDPILALSRSKPPPPPPPPAPPAPAPEPPLRPHRQAETAALKLLDRAKTPDEVVERLGRALIGIARRVVILTVKPRGFEGKFALGVEAGERLELLMIPAGTSGVVDTAIGAGFYLGPVPAAAAQADLARLLALDADGEAYLVPIDVSGRATLVVAISGFDSALGATRDADRLARGAGSALERIVRDRKRARR
jgi:hypothetical protein